jgi:hypothetical protein
MDRLAHLPPTRHFFRVLERNSKSWTSIKVRSQLEVERSAVLSSCSELDLVDQPDRAPCVDGAERVESSS